MRRLEDKVAIITGGSGGIGRATAKQFVDEGAKVLLVDINEEALKDAVAEIGEENVAYTVADVSDEEATKKYVDAAVDTFGKLDILVSNAGIEGQAGTIIDGPIENFDRVIAINVRGVWLSLKYAMAKMAENGGGSIVVTSSVAGVTGTANLSPYGTSKHAVIGIMRAAAVEGAAMGIRVNAVNPGPVETGMMRRIETQFSGGNPEQAQAIKAGYEQMVPLGRYAYPEEIAQLMLFLASNESCYITGTVNLIDGGYTLN